jgi:hypothetical protein
MNYIRPALWKKSDFRGSSWCPCTTWTRTFCTVSTSASRDLRRFSGSKQLRTLQTENAANKCSFCTIGRPLAGNPSLRCVLFSPFCLRRLLSRTYWCDSFGKTVIDPARLKPVGRFCSGISFPSRQSNAIKSLRMVRGVRVCQGIGADRKNQVRPVRPVDRGCQAARAVNQNALAWSCRD